jgi:hypothetical protein
MGEGWLSKREARRPWPIRERKLLTSPSPGGAVSRAYPGVAVTRAYPGPDNELWGLATSLEPLVLNTTPPSPLLTSSPPPLLSSSPPPLLNFSSPLLDSNESSPFLVVQTDSAAIELAAVIALTLVLGIIILATVIGMYHRIHFTPLYVS